MSTTPENEIASIFSHFDSNLQAMVYKNWRCDDCGAVCHCVRMESYVETIIFTWNHERFIGDAIMSWRKQVLKNSSTLVINDDASSDTTVQIAMKHINESKSPITLIARANNQYKVSRFLFVFQLYLNSKSKYLAVLDGDDYWCSTDKLRLATQLLDASPESALIFHDFYVPLRSVPLTSLQNPSKASAKNVSVTSLLSENPIGALTAVFRPNLLPRKIPRGFEALQIADLPIWCALAKQGTILYLPKPLAVYRIHDQNYFANLNKTSQLKAHRQAANYARKNFFLEQGQPYKTVTRSSRMNVLIRLRFTPSHWLRVFGRIPTIFSK
mgnify:CR=1 FL=1